MDKLHQTLMRYFGYDSFKAGQEDIIQSVLNQKDTVATAYWRREVHLLSNSRLYD